MENDLDLTDQFAIEAMKLILLNDDTINFFLNTTGTPYHFLNRERKENFHANFATVCYALAREMQKERLKAFK